MALESNVVYLFNLDPANPTPGDAKSQGDDHLRNIKAAALNSFPGFAGAVMVGGADLGTVNACVLAPTTPLQGYTANTLVVFVPAVTNTGAVTVNVSGLGLRDVRAVNGQPLQAGDLVAGQYVAMAYTGTEFRLLGVTKSYIDNLVFDSFLPTPPAGSGPFILVYQNGAYSYVQSIIPAFLLQAQGIY